MHHTTSTEDHIAASSRSLAACQIDKVPKWIRVGRGTYPFSTYAAASGAYRATIERLGLGVSEAPAWEVLDEAGRLGPWLPRRARPAPGSAARAGS